MRQFACGLAVASAALLAAGCGRLHYVPHDAGPMDAIDAIAIDAPGIDAVAIDSDRPDASAAVDAGGDASADDAAGSDAGSTPDAHLDAVMPDAASAGCGDGRWQPGEECDDGNTTPLDGCHSRCRLEPGWVCTGTPSVCTDSCGNGARAPSEQCDDGNAVNGDGCHADCAIEAGFGCVQGRATQTLSVRGRSECVTGGFAPTSSTIMVSLGGATARTRYVHGAFTTDPAPSWHTDGIATLRRADGVVVSAGPPATRILPADPADDVSFDAATDATFLGTTFTDFANELGEDLAIASMDVDCSDDGDEPVLFRVDALSRCVPIDPSLVAWFELDDSFEDAVPGGPPLMLDPAALVTWIPATRGSAMRPSNGVAGTVAHVDLAGRTTTSWTIVAWVTSDRWSVGAGSDEMFRSSTFTCTLDVGVDTTLMGFGCNALPGSFGGCGAGPSGGSRFRHFAVVYDAPAARHTLYVDGSGLCSGGSTFALDTLELGTHVFYDGLRVYSRALGPAEVAALAVR